MDKKDLPITVGIRGNLLSTDPKRYSVVSTDRVIATRVTQQDAEYIVRLCQQDIFAQEHGLGRLHYCGKCHDQAAEIERLKELLKEASTFFEGGRLSDEIEKALKGKNDDN